MSQTSGADVIVVGGGIVGAACLYYLALAGLKAVLVDRGSIAGGTSGFGDGHIRLSDKCAGPELELAKAGAALWHDLAADVGDFEHEKKGAMLVSTDERGLRALVERASHLATAGVRTHVLGRSQTLSIEPNLTPNVNGALVIADDAYVEPVTACRALVGAAERNGARTLWKTPVRGIQRDANGAACGVLTAFGAISAPAVILACGVGTPALGDTLGIPLPILPCKGHVVVSEPLPHVVERTVYDAELTSLVHQARNGTLMLGSSFEFKGLDATIDTQMVAEIARGGARLFPRLALANGIRAYAGFRPCAPDGLPLVGPLHDVPGVFVNAGHGDAGVGIGPISAQKLVDLIIGKPIHEQLAAFDPNRFVTAGAAT